jgi:hypothetical protein
MRLSIRAGRLAWLGRRVQPRQALTQASRRRRIAECAKVGGPSPPRPTCFQSLKHANPLNGRLVTNKSLLTLSIFLILVGLVFGLYFISVLGLLLVLPALAQTKPRTPRGPAPTPTVSTRRISPPPAPPVDAYMRAEPSQMATTAPVESAPPSTPPPSAVFSAPLFPGPVLPSFSQPAQTDQQVKQSEKPKGEIDEVLELGLVLTALKFAFG